MIESLSSLTFSSINILSSQNSSFLSNLFISFHSFSNFGFLNRIQNILTCSTNSDNSTNYITFTILSRNCNPSQTGTLRRIIGNIANTNTTNSFNYTIKGTKLTFILRRITTISFLHLINITLNSRKAISASNKSRLHSIDDFLNNYISLLILQRIHQDSDLSLVNLLSMHLLNEASNTLSSRIEFKGLTIFLRGIQLILDFRINLAVVTETNRNQTIFGSSLCANDKFSQGSNLILSDVITGGFDICNLESSTLVFELFNSRSNNTSSLFLLHVARLNLPHRIHNASQQFIEFDSFRGKLLDHSFGFFNGIHLCINGQSSSLNERSCILLGICKDAFHSRSHCHYITSFFTRYSVFLI